MAPTNPSPTVRVRGLPGRLALPAMGVARSLRFRPLRAPARDRFVTAHHLDRGRALVRVHPDDHLAHRSPPCSSVSGPTEPGGHRYFQQNKPLLSLSSPTAASGPRRPNDSHTTSVGSRNESDGPGT